MYPDGRACGNWNINPDGSPKKESVFNINPDGSRWNGDLNHPKNVVHEDFNQGHPFQMEKRRIFIMGEEFNVWVVKGISLVFRV